MKYEVTEIQKICSISYFYWFKKTMTLIVYASITDTKQFLVLLSTYQTFHAIFSWGYIYIYFSLSCDWQAHINFRQQVTHTHAQMISTHTHKTKTRRLITANRSLVSICHTKILASSSSSSSRNEYY